MENTSEKSVAFAMPLSKYNRCNGNTLKSESPDDFSSSEEDERPPCVSMVEGEVIKDDRQDVPFPLIECSESEGKTTKKSISFETSLQDHLVEKEIADDLMLAEDEGRLKERTVSEKKHPSKGMQEDDSVAEEGSGLEEEYNQQNEATVFKMPLEKDDTIQYKTKIRPVPKPREFKTKAASASGKAHFFKLCSTYCIKIIIEIIMYCIHSLLFFVEAFTPLCCFKNSILPLIFSPFGKRLVGIIISQKDHNCILLCFIHAMYSNKH